MNTPLLHPDAPLDDAPAVEPDRNFFAVPRLSVVVPTCGRPELLLRCLQALAVQTLGRPAFEVLVVDDGHDNATAVQVRALAVAYPDWRLRYLRPTGGQGPAVARNCGWHAAATDLIAFTDDDTVPLPDWLAEGERAMAQGLWAALGGRVAVPRPPGPLPTDHERMTLGLEATEFVTANAFVRRDALERVGGFDEEFQRPWREDSDLQFRLDAEAGPVGRCEQAVVLHPVRPERWGVSLRQQKNAFFDALLYRKHPQLYRARVRPVPPWDYYAIVLLGAAGVALLLAGDSGAAAVCAVLALGLVLRFAFVRLRHTSRAPAHVLEMLATSALIPFLSVYWRLRGALHFRVWFL